MRRGFTLVELSAVLGTVATLSLISAQESSFENNQLKSRAMGSELFQYNLAVGRYLAHHAARPEDIGSGLTPSSPQFFLGSRWLKDTSCGDGLADREYLSCDYLPNNQTIQFGKEPRTTISIGVDGAIKARTVWAPSISSQGAGGAGMGIAAMVASASYMSMDMSDGSAYQGPTVYCPDMTSVSHTIDVFCDSDRDRIISTASSAPSLDVWLRTDHGNTMQHALEFSSSPSSQVDLDLIDDGEPSGGWSGAGMRQIVNVARIYNRGGSGSDSLILGGLHRSDVYSDAFITVNDLLEDSIIVDGDAGVMSDLYVRMSAFIDNRLTVENDIRSTSGNIVAETGNIVANEGNILTVSGDVVAGNNVRSFNDVIADRDVYVAQDAHVAQDVHVGNNVIVENLVHSRAMLDYSDPRVFSEGGHLLHMKGASRLNNLEIGGALIANGRVKFTRMETEGASCTGSFGYGTGYSTSLEGSLSMSTNGNLVICKDARWRTIDGTPSGTYSYFGTNSCPYGWTYANGNNGTRDLRNHFIRGTSGSRNAGNVQGDAIRNIRGTMTTRIYASNSSNILITGSGALGHSGGLNTGGSLSALVGTSSTTGSRTIDFDASRSVPTANENRPRNIAMRPCMKL